MGSETFLFKKYKIIGRMKMVEKHKDTFKQMGKH